MCELLKASKLDRINSQRPAGKIIFLNQEIQIPEGVSDAAVSEIQETLNLYENPLLKLGQELLGCVGSSNFERCLEKYKQFEVKEAHSICLFISFERNFNIHSTLKQYH